MGGCGSGVVIGVMTRPKYTLFLFTTGYLTLESMITTADTFFAVYPKVDRQTVIAQYERTWKVLYNKGQDVPEGR